MTDQPVRVTFNTDLSSWQIEQQVIRLYFDPLTASSQSYTAPISIRGWELRSVHDNFYRAMVELLEVCCTAGANPLQITSIDLGPLDPQSALVQSIISGLESLTL